MGIKTSHNKFSRKHAFLALSILVFFIVTLVGASVASARMGGGQTFGGGGYSSSSGSSSSSGGDGIIFEILFRILIELCFHYPIVGIPLLITIVVIFMYCSASGNSLTVNNFNASGPPPLPPSVRDRDDAVTAMKRHDPNFSTVLFTDFARLVFTRYKKAFALDGPAPETLRPFVSTQLYTRLANNVDNPADGELQDLQDFIIGAASVESISAMGHEQTIGVRFVFNYTCKLTDGTLEKPMYEEVRAVFSRKSGVLSKGPEKMRSLHCPKCGSPVKCDKDGTCAHCGAPATPGQLQWQLKSLMSMRRMLRDAIERETPQARASRPAKPPVIHRLRDAMLRDLALRDPSFNMEKFKEMVADYFLKLQKAWSTTQWESTRELQTLALYQQNLFWIERYIRQGLRNPLDDAQVISILPVKVENDAFFDSITVRITGSGKDYVVDGDNIVLAGSKRKDVEFREYWTFIRRNTNNNQPKDNSGADSVKESVPCPNCSAPVDNAANSECPYCGSALQSDEFGWTLAYISQEGAYFG